VSDRSVGEMVDRLQHSLRKLLLWAEAAHPHTLRERAQYDLDLDEAEDLLEAAAAWMALHGPPGPRPVPRKSS